MTEYDSSPAAVQEFLTSRDRTAHWVRAHSPSRVPEFASPSVPPSVIPDPDGYAEDDSDAESSHSLPPRMVLRYGDGRVEVPDTSYHSSPHSRVRTRSNNVSPTSLDNPGSWLRSRSGGSNNTSHRSKPMLYTPSHPPEDIRILPSPPASGTPSPSSPHSAVVHSSSGSHRSHSRSHNSQLPPSIVYAPSAHHTHAHYAPPPIMYGSPQVNQPPKIVYSQSAPEPPTHKRHGGHSHMPFPSTQVPPTYGTPVIYEEPRSRSRSRHPREPTHSRSATLQMDTSSSRSHSRASRSSGSTYYVMPAPGQKVKIIAPESTRVSTATSSTKHGSSPASSNGKKPFFQRLFGIGDAFSSSSKRIQRRHSTGGVAYRRPAPA